MGKNNRTLYIILTIALMASAIIFYFHYQSDASKIKRTIHHLSSAMEKKGEERDLIALGKTKSIMDCFSEHPRIILPNNKTYSPEDQRTLAMALHTIRQQFDGIDMDVLDISVTVNPDRTLATATITVEGTIRKGNTQDEEIITFETEWINRNNIWLIAEVATTDSIVSPASLTD